jgi:hypothetical protein
MALPKIPAEEPKHVLASACAACGVFVQGRFRGTIRGQDDDVLRHEVDENFHPKVEIEGSVPP